MNLKWDRRFLDLAQLVAGWSKDPSSKIGAVIVRPDRTIAAVGFNGFARGVLDDEALYANRDFKIATVIHAEENAILSAGASVKGCTLYVSGLPPCASCSSKIIQADIRRVVYLDKPVPDRWRQNIQWGCENLMQADVEIDVLPLVDEFEDAGGC